MESKGSLNMNILILGSGAREHAIAWAVKQNPKCSRLLVAPGNAGIADIAEISKTNIENCDEVVDLAKREKIYARLQIYQLQNTQISMIWYLQKNI